MQIRVKDMRQMKDQGSKLLAFADVSLVDGELEATIRGCQVVCGSKGPFVSMPASKGKDGRYWDQVRLSRALNGQVNKAVLAEYERVYGPGEWRGKEKVEAGLKVVPCGV